MTTIRLLDARRGLHSKCVELFKDVKIAELIYRFLCDGIEECEDAEPERKRGKWIWMGDKGDSRFMCSVCKWKEEVPTCMGVPNIWEYCPSCGSYMRGEGDE